MVPMPPRRGRNSTKAGVSDKNPYIADTSREFRFSHENLTYYP